MMISEQNPVLWDIIPGQLIRRTELQQKYGGNQQSGITPSRSTPNILIFIYPGKGVEFGYEDRELEDGTFVYSGEGKVGDQKLIKGNKAILNHLKDDMALRVFRASDQNETIVEYIGEFFVGDPPFQVVKKPDINKNVRDVFEFNLIPAGSTVDLDRVEIVSSTELVTRKPVQVNDAKEYSLNILGSTTVAQKIESVLQEKYEQYLKSLKIDVATLEIRIKESGRILNPDLVDFTSSRIIEAKGNNSRGSIRMAIGQVQDYVFQAKRSNGSIWSPSILFPGRPSEDLVELIKSKSIELIWEDVDGTFRTE